MKPWRRSFRIDGGVEIKIGSALKMKPIFIKSVINNFEERPLNADEFHQIRNYKYLQFDNPESLLKEYPKENTDKNKIELAYFISKIFKEMSINTAISVGVGESVIEYMIKNQCPNIEISISDFDRILLEHLERVYKNIFSGYYRFDISKDTFDVLKKGHYQMAFINAVLYVLNDEEVKFFFKNLANLKIEYLLIVSRAHLELIPEIKGTIIGILKKLLKKDTHDFINDNEKNTFWGWARYKHEIVSLAQSSGYHLIKYYHKWNAKSPTHVHPPIYLFSINKKKIS